MKRICFFSVATHLGGAERSLLDLLDGMEGSEYEPWVLIPQAKGPLLEQLDLRGVAYDVLEMPANFLKMSRKAPLQAFLQGVSSVPGLAGYLKKLKQQIYEKESVLIHTTGIKCHILSALLLQKRIPLLWHLRDIFKGTTRTILKGLRRISDPHIIANSNATLDSLVPPGYPAEIIYNGLDADKYTIQRHDDYRDHFRVGKKTKIIGVLGVLARWKGQIEFLRMAAGLLAKGADARFVIVGGEIYDTVGERGFTDELIEEANRLQISDKVYFTGFTKDPVRALNGIDVLVHSSIAPEPFGRVIVEGWACQVPVVAAGDGGVIELIEDGKTGLLFEPGKVDQMVEKVNWILHNPEQGEKMAEAGHQRFLDKFTQQTYVQGILDAYENILCNRQSKILAS